MKGFIYSVILLFIISCVVTKSFSQQKFVHAVWYNVYQIDLSNQEQAKQIIDQHFKQLAEMKINTIVFLVKYPNGLVYYKSKYARPACDWDVLEYVVKKCREYNMEIHPYLNIFAEEGYFLQ